VFGVGADEGGEGVNVGADVGVGGAFLTGDGVEGEGDDRRPSSCAEWAFLGQVQSSATGAG
jgi:hypothetical protein